MELAEYYKKICPNFTEKAKVSHKLAKKNKFKWSDEAQKAFKKSKRNNELDSCIGLA